MVSDSTAAYLAVVVPNRGPDLGEEDEEEKQCLTRIVGRLVIWLAVVIGGEPLAVGGDPTGLDALVQSQIVPALVIAPIFY